MCYARLMAIYAFKIPKRAFWLVNRLSALRISKVSLSICSTTTAFGTYRGQFRFPKYQYAAEPKT